MARSNTTDHLQVHRFHLVDVATLLPPGLPVFLPQAGFNSISGIEVAADMEEIPEGNFPGKRKVIKGATPSTVTLTRGATMEDSDFWRWFIRGVMGNKPALLKPRVRRNLLLIQFMQAVSSGAAGATAALAAFDPNAAAAAGVGAAGVAAAGEVWRIPAKAWMLWYCLPGRWKASGDFDASSGDISIAELDVEPELVEEFSLTGG